MQATTCSPSSPLTGGGDPERTASANASHWRTSAWWRCRPRTTRSPLPTAGRCPSADAAVEVDVDHAVLADELHRVGHAGAVAVAEARDLTEAACRAKRRLRRGVCRRRAGRGRGAPAIAETGLDAAVQSAQTELVEGMDARRHQHAAAVSRGRGAKGTAVRLHPELDRGLLVPVERASEPALGEERRAPRGIGRKKCMTWPIIRRPGARSAAGSISRQSATVGPWASSRTCRPAARAATAISAVPVVGGRDHHRVDRRVVEECSPVGIGEPWVATKAAAARGRCRRRRAGVRLPRDRCGVDGAEVAGADDADSERQAFPIELGRSAASHARSLRGRPGGRPRRRPRAFRA